MIRLGAVSKKDESKQGISKSQKHGSDMKKNLSFQTGFYELTEAKLYLQ